MIAVIIYILIIQHMMSDYTTYDGSVRERKKYENVRYWNPICEI